MPASRIRTYWERQVSVDQQFWGKQEWNEAYEVSSLSAFWSASHFECTDHYHLLLNINFCELHVNFSHSFHQAAWIVSVTGLASQPNSWTSTSISAYWAVLGSSFKRKFGKIKMDELFQEATPVWSEC